MTKKSPAAKLGLRPGDSLKSVNGKPLGSCLDWFAHLLVQKVDNELKLSVSQGKKTKAFALKLTEHPTPPTLEIENPKPGLLFEVCHGTFDKAPAMKKQKIVKTGVAPLGVLGMGTPKTDGFAIKLEGTLKIPDDGVYRLILNSDDGSILRTGTEILVDNDGPHPAQDAGRLLRLKKGYLPIRIDYFEATGTPSSTLHRKFIRSTLGRRPPVLSRGSGLRGHSTYFFAFRISAILTGLPPRLADKSAAKISSWVLMASSKLVLGMG